MQRKYHEMLQQASQQRRAFIKDSIEPPILMDQNQSRPVESISDNTGNTTPDERINDSPRQDGSVKEVIYQDVTEDTVPQPALSTDIQFILKMKKKKKTLRKSNLQTYPEQETPAETLSDVDMVEHRYYETYS